MTIEVKNSIKPVDYVESIKMLEKRVEEVILGKKSELLWILEHETVYTSGKASSSSDLINKNIKFITGTKILITVALYFKSLNA